MAICESKRHPGARPSAGRVPSQPPAFVSRARWREVMTIAQSFLPPRLMARASTMRRAHTPLRQEQPIRRVAGVLDVGVAEPTQPALKRGAIRGRHLDAD